MEFYKNCKTLPIYSFNEILKDNDLRFLIKDYDEYNEEEIKLGGVDLVEASEIFKSILYEYSELTLNRSLMLNYNSQINITKEEFRYSLTEKILNFYTETEDLNVLNMLNNLDWKLDLNLSIEDQVKNIVNNMRKLKTKISILKLKHEEKFKTKKVEDKKEYVDKLESEAIALEIALKIAYPIDLKKTSVSKWINMWSVAEKRQKQYQQPT